MMYGIANFVIISQKSVVFTEKVLLVVIPGQDRWAQKGVTLRAVYPGSDQSPSSHCKYPIFHIQMD